jgi:hypothetical protein
VDAALRSDTKLEHNAPESPTNSISAFVLIHLGGYHLPPDHHM